MKTGRSPGPFLPSPSGTALHAFPDRRNALAAADAHGGNAVAAIDADQFMQQLGDDHRAGCADRVAERDGAAIDVGSGRIEAEALGHRQRLRGKGLVRLDDIDLVQRQAGLLQGDLCLLYTSPSPRDRTRSRMPSSA